MSIFETLGLVERVDAEDANIPDEPMQVFTGPNNPKGMALMGVNQPNVLEITDNNVDNQKCNENPVSISEIYDTAGLSDLTRSIYKVEEVEKTLPDSITKEVKRQSVLGILTSFGLSAKDVVDDGNMRIDVITNNSELIKMDADKFLESVNAEIEKHEKAISELQKAAAEKKENANMFITVADEECKRIKNILKFIQD